MAEPENDLTFGTEHDTMRAYLDKQAAEIGFGEIGTDEEPALLRCKVHDGKITYIRLELPSKSICRNFREI